MAGKPSYSKDTIVAPATPPGVGGVAIVRVSGKAAADIAQQLGGRMPKPRYATMARIRDAEGEPIDQGMLLWFPGPNSFTGEDVLELHLHGGPLIVDQVVDAALAAGARRAAPGEFSKRAYLNNRLDLVQAEAVADLIASGTRQAARAALRSLSGEFSSAVSNLQALLTTLRVHVEAALDFPDEEIDFLSDAALLARVDSCVQAFDELAQKVHTGRMLRDGFQLVIIGRPNAGKSSLLNRLSGEESAIVTEVAGTTRDVLRETIDIDGLAVEIVDTAGLRADPDRIEAEGIRRAREAIASADAILWLISADQAQATESLDALEPGMDVEKPVLKIFNKKDLLGEAAAPPGVAVAISALTGDGMEDLRRSIREMAGYENKGEGAFTARRRHLKALDDARKHVDNGVAQLKENAAGEIFAEELRMAQQSLSVVTGEFSSDDLLGEIFSSFCIGK